jgi:hypothetical protein
MSLMVIKQSPKNNKENYLSSKEAGKLLGYTHDYISRLCRQGHMSGIQKGREWFVLPSELENFKRKHEIFLQEKKKQLSQKLSQIRKQAEAQKRAAKQKIDFSTTKSPKQAPDSVYKTETKQHKLRLSIPKRLVATLILLFIVAASSIFNALSTHQFLSFESFSNIQVANISAINTLNVYTSSISELPSLTIESIRGLGDAYIDMYTLQGELILQALQDISYVGHIAMNGYQVIGESFVIGSDLVADHYVSILYPVYDTYSAHPVQFLGNIYGGYMYAYEHFATSIAHVFFSAADGLAIISSNVSTNMASMVELTQDLSRFLTASIQSALTVNEDSTIEVIKIKQN